MKKVIKDIFLNLIFNILKICMSILMIYQFYLKERRLKQSTSLLIVDIIKDNIIDIIDLKQPLNHWLVSKEVQKVIIFNQNAQLKPYIDINTDLQKKAKNDFGKDLFRLMNNSVFGKTMVNVITHRDIKVVTIEKNMKLFSIIT